jgi:spheroidene monooxygenase
MTAGQLLEKHPIAPPAAASAPPGAADVIGQPGTVVVLLANLRPAHWLWGWNRIAFSRWQPLRMHGLRWMKTLGSGRGGGFGLMPSPSHQGLFCLFDDDDCAREFIASASLVERYRQSSNDFLLLTLRPSSSRGSWDGMSITPGPPLSADAPLAALTRASVRPLAAASFWRHAPLSQAGLKHAQGCELAVGLGEAPLLRQATFSLWRDTVAMDAYARSGAHQQAIRAAWQQQFFSESMFVRFAPLSIQGRWQGRDYG